MNAPIYQVRRERGLLEAGWLRARFSFSFGDYVHPLGDRFGPVLALNEDEVQPGTGFPMHPHRNLEILMIPREGAIAHEDSLGHRLTVRPGEVLHMRAGHGIRHSQYNASATEVDRHLQLWIEPQVPSLEPAVDLQPAGVAPCGSWSLVAAAPGAGGALTIAQDAQVSFGTACADQPLELALPTGYFAYLHVMQGSSEVRLGGGTRETLAAGEALAVEALPQPASLQARGQRCEFLLVVFPASLALRNRTSAVVRAGR
jgi:redox-sensitive bicupin YhaK (pirin superfamily)